MMGVCVDDDGEAGRMVWEVSLWVCAAPPKLGAFCAALPAEMCVCSPHRIRITIIGFTPRTQQQYRFETSSTRLTR